jgi:molybdenum cofactor biosynthesis enzyme MoaA
MKRFYFALTNKCNRTCRYCSCFSRPDRNTFLPFDVIKNYIDGEPNDFEIQLEGGEPLLHPDFYNIIEYSLNTNRCKRIILTTNFAVVTDIDMFINQLNFDNLTKFSLKPSINHELYNDDPDLFEKMKILKSIISLFPKFELIFNVRLDKTEKDSIILKNLEKNNLKENSNIFYYQRYGYASNNENFDLPFIIDNPVDFHLISPDGKDFGMDLIARSEHMKLLL